MLIRRLAVAAGVATAMLVNSSPSAFADRIVFQGSGQYAIGGDLVPALNVRASSDSDGNWTGDGLLMWEHAPMFLQIQSALVNDDGSITFSGIMSLTTGPYNFQTDIALTADPSTGEWVCFSQNLGSFSGTGTAHLLP